MESDEVNSIGDTVEAEQVVDIIEDVYYNLIENSIIPEHKELFTLTALGDTDHPNYFKIPTNVLEFDWIKYDVRDSGVTQKEFKTIKYMSPEEFVNRSLSLNSDNSDIDTVTDFGGVPLLIENDKDPSYYTSFDDEYIVFNSYNSAVDSTVQASKSMAYGTILPTFTRTDSFTPDLDANLFPLFISEAKSMCFTLLKQAAAPKVEQQARRQRTALQNNLHRNKIKNKHYGPNYGRK